MNQMAAIFSLIFTVVMFIYIYLGFSILKLNRRERLSKLFAIICLAASIWSLGYAMANTSQNIEDALFWRRVAAIGWAPIYSLTLHFFLLLVNQETSLRQKRLFFLVHIPGFIYTFIYSISDTMARIQYNMIKIDYGWINKPVNNLWDYGFYIYCIVYILSSLIIVWKWKKIEKRAEIQKQANFFLQAILFSFILGSFIDLIWNSIFKNSLPQISPLFILLPMLSMYKSAKYDGLIKLEKLKQDEIIVTWQDQVEIFNNISLAFFIGSILSFFSEYFPNRIGAESDLRAALINSSVLLTISIALRLVQNIKNQSLKEFLDILILLITIPIIILRFIEYGSVTIWGFPIILMMSSLLFSKKTFLISITIVSIITQRLVWILAPEVLVIVNGYDYITRMMVFVFAYIIGRYINKTYVGKIKENNYQIELQRLNSEVSFDFMTVNPENFDEKVDRLLSKLGSF